MGRRMKPHLSQFFKCEKLEKTEEEKKFERENGKYWKSFKPMKVDIRKNG